jgi:uncharacterized membrane protein YdjX (TVP38/TMEM64 family)
MNRRFRLLLGAAAVAAVVAVIRLLPIQDALRAGLAWVDGLGAAGVVLYVLLYVAACVLFVPGSILTLGAGALFGVLKGWGIVTIAATLGATAAFLVGRHLARGWVARKLEAYPRFRAVDEAVGREGWKIVGLIRLSPVFPFSLLNYAFGLTKVRLRDYFFATLAGMLPGTLMYVYLGSLAGSLATLGSGNQARTPAQWAFYGLGLLATVAVTVYVTRVARAALARAIAPPPDGEAHSNGGGR